MWSKLEWRLLSRSSTGTNSAVGDHLGRNSHLIRVRGLDAPRAIGRTKFGYKVMLNWDLQGGLAQRPGNAVAS